MRDSDLKKILSQLSIPLLNISAEGWASARCPFAPFYHEAGVDRRPSFFAKVNSKGFSAFNCYACHEHGPILKLIRMLEGLREVDYSELYIEAALAESIKDFGAFDEPFEIFSKEPTPLIKAQFVGMFPLAWENKESRKYLQERSIGKKTAEKLELYYDDEKQRILFPVYGKRDDANGTPLYGFTGRTILHKFAYPYASYGKVEDYAGLVKSGVVLGEHMIVKGKPLLVVEGLFAYAHLHEIGADKFFNVVALLGATLNPAQADIIIDYAEKTFLCLDDDLAGDVGLYGPLRGDVHAGGGAIDLLKSEVPLYLALYPDGITDVDNFMLEHVEQIRKKNHVPLSLKA